MPYPPEADRALDILRRSRVIALVGASPNPARPANDVMAFLLQRGHRVIPVNPGQAGKTILGQACYASLAAIPEPVDLVDIFRAADAVPGVVDEAIAIGARAVWLQLGLSDPAACARAEAAGLAVVMDRCPKIEYRRAAAG